MFLRRIVALEEKLTLILEVVEDDKPPGSIFSTFCGFCIELLFVLVTPCGLLVSFLKGAAHRQLCSNFGISALKGAHSVVEKNGDVSAPHCCSGRKPCRCSVG